MRAHPRVSVITPALNSAATIVECIQSVTSQDYKNIEHIVIDGESTDGTLELLRPFYLDVASKRV